MRRCVSSASIFGIDGYMSSIYAESDGKFTSGIERSLAHRTSKTARVAII